MSLINKMSSWGIGYGKKVEEVNFSCKKISESFPEFQNAAQYEIKCKLGHGHTVGNAIRRTLLTDIAGAAIVAVKIQNAKHMFDTVTGIKETVMDIVMALRKFVCKLEEGETAVFEIKTTGPGPVIAGNFTTTSGSAKIVHKNVRICTLDRDFELEMEVLAAKHVGFVEAEKHNVSFLPDGAFCVDTLFNPVLQVAYTVEEQTGGAVPFEIINLKIITNGSVSADEALEEASMAVYRDFAVLAKVQTNIEETNIQKKQDALLNTDLEVFKEELQTRTLNRLREKSIVYVKDLLEYSREELKAMPGVGEKALEWIDKLLSERGLSYAGSKRKNLRGNNETLE